MNAGGSPVQQAIQPFPIMSTAVQNPGWYTAALAAQRQQQYQAALAQAQQQAALGQQQSPYAATGGHGAGGIGVGHYGAGGVVGSVVFSTAIGGDLYSDSLYVTIGAVRYDRAWYDEYEAALSAAAINRVVVET